MTNKTIIGVDVDLLRVFASILRTGNTTRTAERLHLTQSAVSKAIGRLRELFGDPLFLRHSRGLIPTPRARELEAPLIAALSAIDQLMKPVDFDLATVNETITIAATDYGSSVYITPLLQQLRETAPGVRIAIRPLTRLAVTDQLENGEIDLALGGIDKAPEGLMGRLLARDPFCVIARRGHPVVKGNINLPTFCALEHVLMSPGGEDPFAGRVDKILAELGVKRTVVVSVPSFIELGEIIRSTDLIAVGPRSLFEGRSDTLQTCTPPLEIPPLPLAALWHPRSDQSPLHQWLRRSLVKSGSQAT
jgi:DNA-binding transcriptional LysR family regulator